MSISETKTKFQLANEDEGIVICEADNGTDLFVSLYGKVIDNSIVIRKKDAAKMGLFLLKYSMDTT